MRAKVGKKRMLRRGCVVCNRGMCVDEKLPKVTFKINTGYTGRVTRSIRRALDHINDFILVEIYRCMPLLGDEEKVPNWDVHIVRLAVVFTGM